MEKVHREQIKNIIIVIYLIFIENLYDYIWRGLQFINNSYESRRVWTVNLYTISVTGEPPMPLKGVDMMREKIRWAVILLAVMMLVVPMAAPAATVGNFTQVTGEVDLLKGGKIPAIPVRVQGGVEAGDVIRTKARAKVQLTMVDDSVITLAPESRLAIADFHYDAARNDRRAVLRLFRGLVHTVVKRLIKAEEPDFVMETLTAVLGVRGTDWYTLLGPNYTAAYLLRGALSVRSNNPGIPALLLLQSMQYTLVPLGKQPYLPQALTPETIKMLEHLMDTGLPGGGLGFGVPAPGGSLFQVPSDYPVSPDQRLKMETIPPVLLPSHQTAPSPQTPVTPQGQGTLR
jgi:hypothetical protein